MEETDLDSLLQGIITESEELDRENEDLNKDNDILDKEINLEKDKIGLIVRLQGKIEKMTNRRIMVDMKYSDYKVWYDRLSLIIILISATLTILEAIKNDIDLEKKNAATKQFLKITPLIISTTIGLLAAIIKFKKYQDKMESIARSVEKSIFTTYRMKKLQEDLHFAHEKNFEKIKQIYLDEIFNLYNQTQAELEKNLKFQDIIKYTQKKNILAIEGDRNHVKLVLKKDRLNKKHHVQFNSKNTQYPENFHINMNGANNEIVDI